MYVQVKELPHQIQSLLSSLGYGRKDIDIEARESVSPQCGGCDGHRAFVAMIDLSSGKTDVKLGSWSGANMFNEKNQVDNDGGMYTIPPNVAVIKGSEGGGKPVHARLIVRPEMLVPLLPTPKGTITPRLQWIVDVIGTFTSAGRKSEFEGYEGSRKRVPPTEVEWLRLIDLCLIKRTKAGAVSLTTEGKNARSGGYGNVKYVDP